MSFRRVAIDLDRAEKSLDRFGEFFQRRVSHSEVVIGGHEIRIGLNRFFERLDGGLELAVTLLLRSLLKMSNSLTLLTAISGLSRRGTGCTDENKKNCQYKQKIS
jgi:hypothetical protein